MVSARSGGLVEGISDRGFEFILYDRFGHQFEFELITIPIIIVSHRISVAVNGLYISQMQLAD